MLLAHATRMGAAALLAVTVVVAIPSPRARAAEAVGYWAKSATPFQELREERQLIFPSPNGRALALIDGLRVWVRVDRKVRHLDRDSLVGWPAELAWSPDSKAFFVTQTDAGLDGTWYSRVFLVERDAVRVVDPAREAASRFRAQYSCARPEGLNAVAVAWLAGARQLLVVTEALPHSRCLAGYVVAMPSARIERELTADALKRDFGALLGPRLVVP